MSSKSEKTLENLFHDTLKDIYYAERKILKTLPKMRRAAKSDQLRSAFEKHEQETEIHVERLTEVFELMGKTPQGKTCDAINGILEEGADVMEDYRDTQALDAALIASAQAVEHYEITRYGTLCRWAKDLGMNDAADILAQTLEEETATDEGLTEIAEAYANPAAAGAMAGAKSYHTQRGAV